MRLKDKQQLNDWNVFCEAMAKATVIDMHETPMAKKKRIERLEANHEEWFKYYLPNYYTSEPAPFHIAATKRVMDNPEFYECRAWARELSKSSRAMMENLKMALTKKKKSFLLVSATYDDAERLLLPLKTVLELNDRIKNDYGEQKGYKRWSGGDFVTKKGVSFRALGAGQSPRGTKNDAIRPDVIDIDDIDTDEEVRNRERIKEKMNWCERALFGTRSISSDLLVRVSGNIIGKYTTVTELMKRADHVSIVNIRDKKGRSTWPSKNTEEFIDRVLSKISHNAAQQEYFNNPINDGDTFKKMNYGKVPSLKSCEAVIVYADPATSNKTTKSSSTKAVGIIGFKELKFYVYWLRLDNVKNATFVDWMYEAHKYLSEKQVDTKRITIENNSLQDPFYEQVILPLIYQRAKEYGFTLPITPDRRKKPEKYTRIEGTLEPIHRMGNLIFNQAEKGTSHFEKMEEQWLSVSPDCKTMDGPDMIEGGVWILQNRNTSKNTTHVVGRRPSRRY